MITIKSESQIRKMRAAGALIHEVLEALRKEIEPGVTTLHLDQMAERLIRAAGGTPSSKGYEGFPYTICASVDDLALAPLLIQIRKDLHRSCQRVALARSEKQYVATESRENLLKNALSAACAYIYYIQVSVTIVGEIRPAKIKSKTKLSFNLSKEFSRSCIYSLLIMQRRCQRIK